VRVWKSAAGGDASGELSDAERDGWKREDGLYDDEVERIDGDKISRRSF